MGVSGVGSGRNLLKGVAAGCFRVRKLFRGVETRCMFGVVGRVNAERVREGGGGQGLCRKGEEQDLL
jgi:hypothetical protein